MEPFKNIRIVSDEARDIVRVHFASAADVQRELSCSRATSYKIVMAHKAAVVHDTQRPKPYSVMRREELDRLKIKLLYRPRRGNPHLSDSDYQRSLAKRPRKRRKK